jgi:hypothetical protein
MGNVNRVNAFLIQHYMELHDPDALPKGKEPF